MGNWNIEVRAPLGAISPLFHNIFYLLLDFHVYAGTRFSLRDKRLFEISEVEIAKVNCINKFTQKRTRSISFFAADTRRIYNVVSTSMQRHDVASTLRRCCINVMCLLGCGIERNKDQGQTMTKHSIKDAITEKENCNRRTALEQTAETTTGGGGYLFPR